jgi:DNA-binding NtrC family response regulator
MPGMDGVTLLKRVHAQYPNVACILLTAYGNVETAVEAMKEGAADFLTKPVNLDHLELVVERSLKNRDTESENRNLREQLDSKYGMENLIGNSEAMQPVFDIVRQAAPTQATVLIQGASGTGKELVAKAIHRLSTRKDGPFVAVHCAALAPTLLESELFGHEAGAFTGATARRKGRFELADGGTLFLDEVSEIDPTVQVKLLRVFQERTFDRVGGTETLDVDIRIIAATNRDLRQCVDKGTFREDLFFRLDVVSIHLPPLKDRADDIPVLAMHFLKDFSKKNGKAIDGFSPEAVSALQAYAWPGNVRALMNTIEKMVVMARGSKLELRDVPHNVRPAGDVGTLPQAAQPIALADVEKRQILEVLEKYRGNKTKAAAELGISRRTMHRKLKEWGME